MTSYPGYSSAYGLPGPGLQAAAMRDAIRHQSDVYVFCVYANKDRASANPLVLDDWDFYVLSTLAISSRCGSQQSISYPL